MGPKRKAATLSSMSKVDASTDAGKPVDHHAPPSTTAAGAATAPVSGAALPPKQPPSAVYRPTPMGQTLIQSLNDMLREGSISEAQAQEILVRHNEEDFRLFLSNPDLDECICSLLTRFPLLFVLCLSHLLSSVSSRFSDSGEL